MRQRLVIDTAYKLVRTDSVAGIDQFQGQSNDLFPVGEESPTIDSPVLSNATPQIEYRDEDDTNNVQK